MTTGNAPRAVIHAMAAITVPWRLLDPSRAHCAHAQSMRATAVPAYRVSHMHHHPPNPGHAPQRSAGQPAPQEPSRPSKMASGSQAAGKADRQAHKAPERDRR
ncbi:hypothetical protein [Stenotrophomonas acidaminiphila]|uniref:hypothetical protein n=1 Tax=Stenotrophomonas acidaminiphila TaxID=128780 RepID=UPI001DDB7FBC|nr:hypothetical protein [Stenotrophomonas sp.]